MELNDVITQNGSTQLLEEHVAFATTIFTRELPVDPNIIEKIKKLRDADTADVQISNVGGWQSLAIYDENQYEWLSPIISRIKFYMLDAYNKYGVTEPIKFGNCWFNINKKWNYNLPHSHPASVMSAVLYLKCPSNGGRLMFERPDNLLDYIVPNKINDKNIGTYYFIPRVNQLVIFPANIRHYVEQNLTEDIDDERISIAFNFVLKQK